ncbi:hypothetical protein C8R45DRAFT_1076786 [Mycena sanguinolenta]|nr:hypothetical protein C8R45DRAFT_1076786 [Mycena sanguinolenta]
MQFCEARKLRALTEGGGWNDCDETPRLLVPHLSFNAIGTPFGAVNALRRRCESSYPRSSSRRAQAPKAAAACRRRSRASRQFVLGDLAPHRSACACPWAMSHTEKLPMKSALSPAHSSTFASPTSTSTFSSARDSSFSSSSDDAAVSPSRIRRGAAAAVRGHRRGEKAYAAAAVRARMMEADDGNLKMMLVPGSLRIPTALRRGLRSVCVPDRIPMAGEAAVRVHESLSRILVKCCACFALSVENRELIPFYWDLRSTSAQARGISGRRRWLLFARTVEDDARSVISRIRLDSSLGGDFPCRCDPSHSPSAARPPGRENQVHEVDLAAVDVRTHHRGGHSLYPSNSILRISGRSLAPLHPSPSTIARARSVPALRTAVESLTRSTRSHSASRTSRTGAAATPPIHARATIRRFCTSAGALGTSRTGSPIRSRSRSQAREHGGLACPRASTRAARASTASPPVSCCGFTPEVRLHGRGEAPAKALLLHVGTRPRVLVPAHLTSQCRRSLDAAPPLYARSILTAAAAWYERALMATRAQASISKRPLPSAAAAVLPLRSAARVLVWAFCAHSGSTMSSCPSTLRGRLRTREGRRRARMLRCRPTPVSGRGDPQSEGAAPRAHAGARSRSSQLPFPPRAPRTHPPLFALSESVDDPPSAMSQVYFDDNCVRLVLELEDVSPRGGNYEDRQEKDACRSTACRKRLETVEVEEPYKVKIISQNSKMAEALLQRSSAFEGEGGPAPVSGREVIILTCRGGREPCSAGPVASWRIAAAFQDGADAEEDMGGEVDDENVEETWGSRTGGARAASR